MRRPRLTLLPLMLLPMMLPPLVVAVSAIAMNCESVYVVWMCIAVLT